MFTPPTQQFCRAAVYSHRRHDATRQFRRVGVGGVYWTLPSRVRFVELSWPSLLLGRLLGLATAICHKNRTCMLDMISDQSVKVEELHSTRGFLT